LASSPEWRDAATRSAECERAASDACALPRDDRHLGRKRGRCAGRPL